MTIPDWIIVGVIGLSLVVGLFRGFIKEALSLVGWFAAFLLASMFAAKLAPMFTGIDAPSLRHMVAFASIFVAALIAVALINGLLSALVEATGLSGTDRVLGAVFGLGRGLILVLAAVVFLPGFVPIDQDGWWKESVLIPEFLEFEGWARESFESLYQWIAGQFGS